MGTIQEKAQSGLRQLEDAVLELLSQHPVGVSNAEIARMLGIETGEPGQHRNMLSWSIVSRLVRSGRVERVKTGRNILVRLPQA